MLKVIDFGYATPINMDILTNMHYPNSETLIPSCLKLALPGTKQYMAPELYDAEITGSLAKSDSFSIGVILFNLITGAFPFKSVYDQNYLNAISDPIKCLRQYI